MKQFQCTGLGSSEDFKQVVESLLERISRVCIEKLSQTRCASKINKDDLQDVRVAFKTILQVKDPENDAFVKCEDYWYVVIPFHTHLTLCCILTKLILVSQNPDMSAWSPHLSTSLQQSTLKVYF